MRSGVTYVHVGEAILTIERLHICIAQKGPESPGHRPLPPSGQLPTAVSLWIALHLLEFDINGFVQPMLFWVWLFPLNVIVVRCVRVVCGFYFWVASLAWTHASLLTHSPVINLPLLYDATADGNMAGTQRGHRSHLASKRARTHLCCQQPGREAA